MYIDGPWASAQMPANSVDKSNWASFPIPSENGPNPAPVFAGGSDLGIFKTSKYPQASWDLISVMDNLPNSTSFANLQGFFPPYSSQLTAGPYTANKFLSGFASAAANSQISPLNAKNWPTADTGKYFILNDMLKSLMNGAPFASTVAQANAQLQTVLNTGAES
jgi:N,N'-diacetylchitobiose transport system substrate-binding protein